MIRGSPKHITSNYQRWSTFCPAFGAPGAPGYSVSLVRSAMRSWMDQCLGSVGESVEVPSVSDQKYMEKWRTCWDIYGIYGIYEIYGNRKASNLGLELDLSAKCRCITVMFIRRPPEPPETPAVVVGSASQWKFSLNGMANNLSCHGCDPAMYTN